MTDAALSTLPLTLPSAFDAEIAVLGTVLFDNAAVKALGESLTADSFGEPYHGRLWAMAIGLIERGRLAEPTALAERLREDPAFIPTGGLKFLAEMVENAPNPRVVPDYARRVNDAARRREIIRIAGEAAQAARDPEQEPFSVITATDTCLSALMMAAAPDGANLVDARTSLERTISGLLEDRATGKPRGCMTGLRCFDRRMGGLKAGKLIIVAGRPSMGKSGLCRGAAIGVARRNPDKTALYFTLEMERGEIDLRTLSQLSFEGGRPFKYQDIEDDYENIGPAVIESLAELTDRAPSNLIMDDTPALSVEYVRRRALSQMRKRPLSAIFIDYLQIMTRPEARNGRNDAAVLGEMTSALKQLAREAKCAIVLLSQLSRRVEERDNKRPMLADLRESGAIEQDANAVLFCFREHYYLTREGPGRGMSEADHAMRLHETETRMEVICAKQRGGPVGTDVQRYLAPYDVIEDEGVWP
jgi:replicative DNA helicase